jgi:hypothetical protein
MSHRPFQASPHRSHIQPAYQIATRSACLGGGSHLARCILEGTLIRPTGMGSRRCS